MTWYDFLLFAAHRDGRDLGRRRRDDPVLRRCGPSMRRTRCGWRSSARTSSGSAAAFVPASALGRRRPGSSRDRQSTSGASATTGSSSGSSSSRSRSSPEPRSSGPSRAAREARSRPRARPRRRRRRRIRRLLALTRADLMLLFLIIFDMAVKPEWRTIVALWSRAGFAVARGAARADGLNAQLAGAAPAPE